MGVELSEVDILNIQKCWTHPAPMCQIFAGKMRSLVHSGSQIIKLYRRYPNMAGSAKGGSDLTNNQY
jgi:hypothetical protein